MSNKKSTEKATLAGITAEEKVGKEMVIRTFELMVEEGVSQKEMHRWAKEVCQILRQRITNGEVKPTDNMKALFDLE